MTLSAAGLEADLRTRLPAASWPHLAVVDTTGSTNADLRRAAADLPCGAVRIALTQTAGRGTRGRVWHAPRGGLWLSLLLHTTEAEAPILGLLLAGAVADTAAAEAGPTLQIKWPNDLLWQERKIGGILLERWAAGSGQANTVLGLGLNLNFAPQALPAALRPATATWHEATGRDWALGPVAAALLKRFASARQDWRSGKRAALLGALEARLQWRGTEVVLEAGTARHGGKLVGLAADGSLLVEPAGQPAVPHRFGRLRRAAALLLCLLLGCGLFGRRACRADVLHLKNGGRLEGRVKRTPDGLELRRGSVRMTVDPARVARWERTPLPAEEYKTRRALTATDDPMGQFVLALWCQQNGLAEEAEHHLEAVLALAPDHAEARRMAGYVRSEGAWVKQAARMRAKGLARYKGRWLPAPEAKRLLARERERAERAARAKQARALLRKVSRVEGKDALLELAHHLAKLGPPALPALRRGLIHSDRHRRAVAIVALGDIEDEEAAALLCERMRRERSSRLLRGIVDMLRHHACREAILMELCDHILRAAGSTSRRRLAHALAELGDPAVIPYLIARAEFTPSQYEAVPGQNRSRRRASVEELTPEQRAALPEALRQQAGLQVQINEDKPLAEQLIHGKNPTAPVYPAAEVLGWLTGEDFGHNTPAWQAWWDGAAEGFTFARVDLPERGTPRQLPHLPGEENSLRSYMLKRGWQ